MKKKSSKQCDDDDDDDAKSEHAGFLTIDITDKKQKQNPLHDS